VSQVSTPLWMCLEVHCTCGLIPPYSGRDCVKSLRSSYMGLYPQSQQKTRSTTSNTDTMPFHTPPILQLQPRKPETYPNIERIWHMQDSQGQILTGTTRRLRSGCRVHVSWSRVHGGGFRVQGAGFGVQGSGFTVQGSWLRVQGSGFRVQGAGLHVSTTYTLQGRSRVCLHPPAAGATHATLHPEPCTLHPAP